MIYTITADIIRASRPAADRTMVIVKVQQTSVKQGAFLCYWIHNIQLYGVYSSIRLEMSRDQATIVLEALLCP